MNLTFAEKNLHFNRTLKSDFKLFNHFLLGARFFVFSFPL